MKLQIEPHRRQTEIALSVDGLTKTYGTGSDAVRAVEDVSFEIESGSVVGLVGPNGAGKTTLIKCMLGLIVPSEGTVSINGVDIHAARPQAYEHVSALLDGQRNIYWRLTPRENLRFFCSLQGIDPRERRSEHAALLESFGLTAHADDPVSRLSRGDKQKTHLACTLSRETPVVVLDEPTLGLDVEASYSLRQRIRRLAAGDRTIVLSSHDMDVIQEVCDRLVLLYDGKIVVNDAIEELERTFRTQAYRVTIRGGLSGQVRVGLERSHEIERWDETPDGVRFEVTIEESNALYSLIDRLREADAEIATVSAVDPGLEDVFLRLSDREKVLV